MSILNKVLKDLDKRGQKPGEAESVSGSAVAGPSSRTPWVVAIVAVVLLVIALIFGALSWDRWVENETVNAPQPVPKVSEPEPVESTNNFARPAQTETQTEAQAVTQSSSRQQPVEQHSPAAEQSKADHSTHTAQVPPTSSRTEQPQATESTEVDDAQEAVPESEVEPTPTLVRKTVQLSPEQVITREINAAKQTAEQGLLSEAVKHWQKVLSIDPGHIEARRQLAALQFGRNRWQEALAVLTRGLEVNPQAHELRLLAAKMLDKRQQPQLALTMLKQAQPQASRHLEYYRLKAQLAQQLNQWTLMADSYQSLAQAQPTEGRWWLGRAIAAQQLAQKDAAIRFFNRAKELIQHAPTLEFIEQQLNLLVDQDEATSS
ncbi:MAG: Membrane associated TPR repeats containing protein [Idiomarina sp. T82-3]|uniref:tetratricopeptide repeat protein n=1 Tax=Idiomarina TaxID=135575 RepID=UPI0007976605|nr:tetratricopeptide repeat protein [Idiomarina sp. T82-3]KXS36597.1 MAG: Membrane associated TPR repeats containing protein [Idiomarina sp. T82-3]